MYGLTSHRLSYAPGRCAFNFELGAVVMGAWRVAMGEGNKKRCRSGGTMGRWDDGGSKRQVGRYERQQHTTTTHNNNNDNNTDNNTTHRDGLPPAPQVLPAVMVGPTTRCTRSVALLT
ncbi:hypothetical protein PLESTB_001418200 [Pleodorina starrii]|uniref:Uncharacterized protein n=1 Tax=Pleodorina starrii TaxID=330485 RepID=A0A9W6BW49_9CHLO|nr:hypothetical protein PLESTM_001380100 [Pleodorina starrii]GLC58927.1 hypothetical protein PLESTB_001418200 [Pleodorina starrii]GLC65088.1 hypothetical protein PLESTF_000245300 [Pleodorina starrii]